MKPLQAIKNIKIVNFNSFTNEFETPDFAVDYILDEIILQNVEKGNFQSEASLEHKLAIFYKVSASQLVENYIAGGLPKAEFYKMLAEKMSQCFDVVISANDIDVMMKFSFVSRSYDMARLQNAINWHNQPGNQLIIISDADPAVLLTLQRELDKRELSHNAGMENGLFKEIAGVPVYHSFSMRTPRVKLLKAVLKDLQVIPTYSLSFLCRPNSVRKNQDYNIEILTSPLPKGRLAAGVIVDSTPREFALKYPDCVRVTPWSFEVSKNTFVASLGR